MQGIFDESDNNEGTYFLENMEGAKNPSPQKDHTLLSIESLCIAKKYPSSDYYSIDYLTLTEHYSAFRQRSRKVYNEGDNSYRGAI